MAYDEWRPYVPVAKRRAAAEREMKKLRKKGVDIEPIVTQGRKIAHTFWGEAWCKHLERFSDFANRLPRGRTYVRNGSICHLAVENGKVEAIVSGSELYRVDIRIASLTPAKWKNVRKQCAGQIGSILELLQGKLSNQVMEIVTDSARGLFPRPGDIKFHCNCPDWAVMCKHVAAVLYGVGTRLDEKPELLFVLRKVDHEELITTELDIGAVTGATGSRRRITNKDLSKLFGVDIEDATAPKKHRKTSPRKTVRRSNKGKSDRKTATGNGKPAAGKTKAVLGRKKFPATGGAVSGLRKRLELTRAQFAELIGVSPQTVTNWESKRGRLKLQERTLKALTRAWLRK